MPARMSGLASRSPYSCAGPVTTTRCGSQRMIRAPMVISLSTKNRRFSNIFSKMRIVPRACVATTTAIDVRSAGNAGQGPSSIFGIWPPRSSCDHELLAGGTCTVVPSISTRTPSRSKTRQDRAAGRRLGVLDRDLAAGDRGEADEARRPRCARARSGTRRRRSRSTPSMRSMFEPMPSICAPSETRNRQRSCTCGSQAAFPITVSPVGEHGGHDRVLGAGHARLVEEHARARAGRSARSS